MMLKRKTLAVLLVLSLMVTILAVGCAPKEKEAAADAAWVPGHPIQIVAPFAAGGAIDLMSRAIQPHMEKQLGVPIAVVNMPGGSASIGTEFIYNGKKDGYSALAISTEIATMGTMGHSKLTVDNWNIIGVTCAVPNVFVVKKDSPIKTLDDLVAKMKAGRVTMSVIAQGCPWSRGGMLLAQLAGTDNPEFVPCGGGFPSAQAALKGEVDVGSCGLPEVVTLLQSGDLRALAYWGVESFNIEGVGAVPSVVEFFPDAKPHLPFGGWGGLALPEGTPENIVKKYEEAYKYAIEQPDVKDFIKKNAFIPVYLQGDDAVKWIKNYTSTAAYMLYDTKASTVDPKTLGIERN